MQHQVRTRNEVIQRAARIAKVYRRADASTSSTGARPSGAGGCAHNSWTPSKRIANASAATAAGKSTVTRTASSLWLYLYLMGSYLLASNHSPIAVMVVENSAARIRTVTLRMIPRRRFLNVTTLLLKTKARKILTNLMLIFWKRVPLKLPAKCPRLQDAGVVRRLRSKRGLEASW